MNQCLNRTTKKLIIENMFDFYKNTINVDYGKLIFLIFSCGLKYNNISSRLFPFVSGIINIANNTFNIQKKANIDQMISTPKFKISDGYTLQIANNITYPHVCTTPFITPERKTNIIEYEI